MTAGRTAKLLDASEQFFHIAWVFPQNPAFQHFREHPVAAVPDFAEPDDALVRINLHQGAVHRGAYDVRKTDICDFQFAGI